MSVRGLMATADSDAITAGELVVTGRLVDASNATLFGYVTTVSGGKTSVIYKPIAGERPLWDFPDGTLAAREVAAYLFSEFAGFHLVPFTVLRDGPYGMGAVQEWIDINEEVDIIDLAQSRDESLRQLVLFDAIINNTDRKIGHLLPSLTGELYVCDHGVCFHQEDKLRTVLWQWSSEKFSSSEIQALINISDRFDHFAPMVAELLTAEEIAATHSRLARLIEAGRFPVPSEEWPAIPWPPI